MTDYRGFFNSYIYHVGFDIYVYVQVRFASAKIRLYFDICIMKAVNILRIGNELLKMMSLYDLRVGDYKYIEMYSEYVKERKNHVKYDAIIFHLSQKYGISESSVKRLIRRLDREVNL